MSLRALIIIAIVSAAAPARAQLLSPGPLSQAHADLDTDDDCGKCHSSGKQVDADACLSCHKELNAKVSANRGLHGRAYKGKPCEECHVEHNGRSYRLVRWPGGAMDQLDHKLTGWPLEGAHAKTVCGKCHTQKSFLAARPECGTCHKDAHQGRLGAACQQCHTTNKWEELDLKKFDHGKTRYPLTGAHATVDCAKCHTGTPPKYAPLAFGTCDSCHADPHVGQFPSKPCTKCHETSSWHTADATIKGNHPGVSLGGGHAGVKCEKCHDKGNDKPPTKGSTCVACHPQVHEAKFGTKCEQCHRSIRWLGLPKEIGLAAHDKTKYPLEGLHVQVDCAKCHSPKKPENERYRRVAFDMCARCHADPHQGQLGALAKDCASCHTVRGYTPTTFTVADHARTSYPLDGRHAVTPCAACHGTAKPRVDLRVGKSACADCHQNPHGDQFAAEMKQDGCAHCHTSDRWQQAKIDHSTFPLRGAHARTACERCHGTVEKGAQPAAFRGLPRTCDGCHEDVHAGQFRTSEPKKECGHCHDEETFKLPDFDHAKETGYRLEGAHAKTTCAKCHPSEELRNGASAVRYRLGYRRCEDCHANPHGDGL